ncbi:MAG: 3-phosphoshikimate 1-carboxyvinyltransferase, partial [Chromatiales bacterium]|nr:3-phosphoshikimate 1-carboxyvinyltransferase [Chromatiales bacterium]
QVMADGMAILGIDAKPTRDGMVIQGRGEHQGALYDGGAVDSHGDHRIAMSFAMAALRASAPITIKNCANVATSFPNFIELAKSSGLNIEVNS